MSRTRAVVLSGFLVAMVLAGVVSYYASAAPDGLNRVAIDSGFEGSEEPHPLGGSPLSGYSVRGVDDERLSGGLAGVTGVGVTFLAVGGLAWALRRRDHDRAGDALRPERDGAGGTG